MAYSHAKDCPSYPTDTLDSKHCTCNPFFYCSCGHPGMGCYCR